MKTKLYAFTVLMAMGATAFALAKSDSEETSQAQSRPVSTSRAYLHSYNLPSTGIAMEGYCPVAYFEMNKPMMGKAEFASTHNGVTYHFSMAEAKTMFDADAEKYLPAFGGWCAMGMTMNDKLPVDPTKFKIVDGKLMLFLGNAEIDALGMWNMGTEKELATKAEANWKKISTK